jgi:hypothetical protein
LTSCWNSIVTSLLQFVKTCAFLRVYTKALEYIIQGVFHSYWLIHGIDILRFWSSRRHVRYSVPIFTSVFQLWSKVMALVHHYVTRLYKSRIIIISERCSLAIMNNIWYLANRFPIIWGSSLRCIPREKMFLINF